MSTHKHEEFKLGMETALLMIQIASAEPEDFTSSFVEQKSLKIKNLIERLERLEEDEDEDEDMRECLKDLKNLRQNMEEIKKYEEENLVMEALSLLQEIEAVGEEGFNLESDGPKYLEKLKDIVNRFDKVAPNELGQDIFADSERDQIAKNRFGDIDYTQKYPALRHVTKEEALEILGVGNLTDEQVEREHRSRLVGKTLKFGDIPEGCWIDVYGEPMQVIYEENDRYDDGESIKIAYTKCVERRNGKTYYPNSIEYKVIQEPEQTRVLDIRDLAPYEEFVFVGDKHKSEKFQKCFIDKNHHVMGVLKESGKVAYINHRNAMPNKEVARLVEK